MSYSIEVWTEGVIYFLQKDGKRQEWDTFEEARTEAIRVQPEAPESTFTVDNNHMCPLAD